MLCFFSVSAHDSIPPSSSPLIGRIGIESRPEYVIPTNVFLRGNNAKQKRLNFDYSTHLTFGFQYRPDTPVGQCFGPSTQGIGIGAYDFFDTAEMGNPMALYLFQEAPIVTLNRFVTLRYQWNFGLSWGWEPYNAITNPYNGGVGTRRNAFLNLGVFFDWRLSRYFDIITGVTLSHFSNGNTKYPNAGINTGGGRIGLVYYINRPKSQESVSSAQATIPYFRRHISYDVLLFGSWRRKGVAIHDGLIASPRKYPVAGFSFAPLYNFNYKLRAGLSLDGVYDGSANAYTEDYIIGAGDDDPGYQFYDRALRYRLSLGLSARVEYTMPFFTIGLGMGYNMLYAQGDTRGFYQTLALKINVTRSAYLNIGYNLQNFSSPNFLMLGIGYRFNNRAPRIKWL